MLSEGKCKFEHIKKKQMFWMRKTKMKCFFENFVENLHSKVVKGTKLNVLKISIF